MSRELRFTIPPEYDEKKVIHYLRGAAGLSARLVILLKHSPGGIRCNGAHMRTIDRLHAGDSLVLSLPETGVAPFCAGRPLEILYEDDDLLALNKAPGLVVHPSHNHQGDTLANAVAAYYAEQGRALPFRCIGRLDKGTSGVVVCALNAFAASRLSGGLQKEYLAVAGGLFSGSGVFDTPIYRPDPHKTLRACGAVPGAKAALTHWEALEQHPQGTLLRVTPETGRTHQIRVHFAHAGAPLLGDDMYGGAERQLERPLLHCLRVRLIHPVSGEEMAFTAPPPPDFAAFMHKKCIYTDILEEKEENSLK